MYSASLLKFTQGISQSKGFLTMASFIDKGSLTTVKRKEFASTLSKSLKQEKIQALIQIKEAETVTTGMRHMIENHGLGTLRPNTIVFGGVKKEDESIDFVKILRIAYRRHNNIVILNESKKVEIGGPENIHIWWDNEHQANSELMLVLGYMMQCDRARKRARLFIKAIVATEMERKSKLEEFQRISIEKRLPIDAEVYVSANSAVDNVEMVREFSKDAGMIFFGLAPPPKEQAADEAYIAYLHDLSAAFEGLPLAMVVSSEFTPLDSILE